MSLSRRNFLGWSAVGITGLLVPQIVKPRVTTFVMGSGLHRDIGDWSSLPGDIICLNGEVFIRSCDIDSSPQGRWARIM